VPSLYPAATLAAASYRHVKAPHHGVAEDVFLILGLGALECRRAPTAGTARRQGDRDALVYPAGKRPTVVPAILPARLAPGRFRIRFGPPKGERRRLPLGGPQGLFQLPPRALDLLPQARVFLLQAFIHFQGTLQLLPEQPVLPPSCSSRRSRLPSPEGVINPNVRRKPRVCLAPWLKKF